MLLLIEKQHVFSENLAREMGFDFAHGRIDPTAHPFMSGIPGDVRITTRYHEDDVLSAIMATMHETGHAMYESGLPSDWAFQPVGLARGFGLHESQSLLFEMQAGRSGPSSLISRHCCARISVARGPRGAMKISCGFIAACGRA